MIPFPKALKRNSFLQEGANPAHDVVLLASTIGDDYDNPRNRVVIVRGESSIGFFFDGESVVSIDATQKGIGYALGENGTVFRFDWKKSESDSQLERTLQRIVNPAVAELGPLRRLRVLGSDVVCAGSVGQAYRLVDTGFVALPKLTIGGGNLSIEDLAGVSGTDFVAVTSDGLVAHFDGKAWKTLDVPTTVSLNSICRWSDHRFAIAGCNGSLLIGNASGWKVVPPANAARDYTGIAAIDTTLYLAHLEGIDVSDGDAMRPLVIPQRSRNEFVVLRSGPDGVWSFAGRSVGLVTSNGWQVMA